MENDQKLQLDVGQGICIVAAVEERFDLLELVFNGVGDWDEKEDVFKCTIFSAACHSKLNLLKWLETHQLDIDKERCAEAAARRGHFHILKWLREETGLQLTGELYDEAILAGGQLHVLKWLREEEVDWVEDTFQFAVYGGNLAILQWLHNEGCPWGEFLFVDEEVKPEVVDWLRTNECVN